MMFDYTGLFLRTLCSERNRNRPPATTPQLVFIQRNIPVVERSNFVLTGPCKDKRCRNSSDGSVSSRSMTLSVASTSSSSSSNPRETNHSPLLFNVVEQANGESVLEPVDDVSIISDSSLPTSSYVREILSKRIEGLCVVAEFDEKKALSNDARTALAKALIAEEFGSNPQTKIDSCRFTLLAAKIVEGFPGELQGAWYTPSVTTEYYDKVKDKVVLKTSRHFGKLVDQYDRFCCCLRKVKLRDYIRGKKRTAQDTLNDELDKLQTLECIPPSTLSEEETERQLQVLRSELNDWDEIVQCWKGTVHARQSILRAQTDDYLSADEYINTYSCLKLEDGFKLLELDFGILFPSKYIRFLTKWDDFLSRLREQFDVAKIKLSGNCSDVELFYNIPRLFSLCPMRVPKGKAWKPSRADCTDGFVCHIEDNSRLVSHLVHMETRDKSHGFSVQPFTLVVGKPLKKVDQFYLVFNGEARPFPTFKAAFAATFYAFHALYCSYAFQSERAWALVQKILFDMDLGIDVQTKRVDDDVTLRRLIAAMKID